jgi:low affinity Fe/Cu permease
LPAPWKHRAGFLVLATQARGGGHDAQSLDQKEPGHEPVSIRGQRLVWRRARLRRGRSAAARQNQHAQAPAPSQTPRVSGPPPPRSPVEEARRQARPAGVSRPTSAAERFLNSFETLSERVTAFVSSHWGTLTACGFLIVGSAVFLTDRGATVSATLENFLTLMSLALLFLLQRSQTKATLSLQVKLNELLRAMQESDNHLINIERLSEDELRHLHDRYQTLHDERWTSRED